MLTAAIIFSIMTGACNAYPEGNAGYLVLNPEWARELETKGWLEPFEENPLGMHVRSHRITTAGREKFCGPSVQGTS